MSILGILNAKIAVSLLFSLFPGPGHATQTPGAEVVTIRVFDSNRPRDFLDYKELNMQWLRGYRHWAGCIPALLEPADLVTLDDPVREVLEKQGQIWFAESSTSETLGTVALTRDREDWEIAMIAVTPEAQSRGTGRQLLLTAIEYGRAKGLAELYLDTSSKLKAAVALYESVGFVRLQKPRGKYVTSDIAMKFEY